MNLLPEKNKILFKRYYLRRLFTVFGLFVLSIIAAGGIVLTSAYLITLSYKSGLNGKLATYSKKDAKLADSAFALEIKKLNNQSDFVEKTSKAEELNRIFKNILDKKNPGVKIISFSYEKGKVSKIKDKTSVGEDKISLSGKVQKREDLLLFEKQLKKELGERKVVSPVSNLINEKDFDFSLTLYIQNENEK